MFQSLRIKLVIWLAVSLLPAGVLAVIQAVAYYNDTSQMVEQALLKEALVSAQEEQNALYASRQLLEALATLPALDGWLAQHCDAVLESVLSKRSSLLALTVTDAAGQVVCSAAPFPKADTLANRPWFREAMQAKAIKVAAPVTDLVPGRSLLVIAVPTQEPVGFSNGFVVAAIASDWFEMLLKTTDTSPDTGIAFVGQDGRVIVTDDPDQRASAWLPQPGLLQTMLASGPSTFRIEGDDSTSGLYAVAPLLENEVFLIMRAQSSQWISGQVWNLISGITFPILMWLIAVGVAWLTVDRLVVRPILVLQRVARNLAAGDLSARPDGLGEAAPEVRHLGESLSAMARAVQERERELQRSVAEQNMLVREVHHRVKNNLQIVTSLLNMQVQRAASDAEKRALRTIQDRIQALSMVHGSLYQGRSLSRLRLDTFLSELLGYLQRAHGALTSAVSIRTEMDPIEADPTKAIPIALLVTEAVTNAFKHAWPDGQPGMLKVLLKQGPAGDLELIVADDGPRAAEAEALKGGLGRRLIIALAEQLNGRVEVDTSTGYRLKVIMSAMEVQAA